MNPPQRDTLHFGIEPKRNSWIGWLLLALVPVLVLIVSVQPAPYVISIPGPVYNTLGNVEVNGESTPMIAIADAETYPIDGQLNLLTVSQYGRPDQLPSWAQVVMAWFDPSQDITPVDLAYPPGVTSDEILEANRVQMENSQQEAIAAALIYLGYEVPGIYSVYQVIEDAAAEGILQPDDVLKAIDGEAITSVDNLRAYLAENGVEQAVRLLIERDGEQQEVRVTPKLVEGSPALGVLLMAEYDFPIQVQIELQNVGGSSAGMMFALGIIDKLTPGALTNGEIIAGTGTITADGAVGPIGGEPQKVVSASRAGAKWFLIDAEDCVDLPENTPDDLTIIPVATLTEAVSALEQIGQGASPDSFASCSVG